MRFSTYGLFLSLVTVITTFAYVSWNTKQTLDIMRYQPGCFPPYVLMNGGIRGDAATVSSTDRGAGYDGGLKPLDLRSQVEHGCSDQW